MVDKSISCSISTRIAGTSTSSSTLRSSWMWLCSRSDQRSWPASIELSFVQRNGHWPADSPSCRTSYSCRVPSAMQAQELRGFSILQQAEMGETGGPRAGVLQIFHDSSGSVDDDDGRERVRTSELARCCQVRVGPTNLSFAGRSDLRTWAVRPRLCSRRKAPSPSSRLQPHRLSLCRCSFSRLAHEQVAGAQAETWDTRARNG